MTNVAVEGDFYTTVPPIPSIALSTIDTTVSDVITVPNNAKFCKVAGKFTSASPDADADGAYTIAKRMIGNALFSSLDNSSVHRTGQGAATSDGMPSNIDCDGVAELKVLQVENTNGAGAITTVSLPFRFVFDVGATQ